MSESKVFLVGKSSHGKNRVHHQGSEWVLKGFSSHINTVKHRECTGPFALITNGTNIRWVCTNDDPDFEVTIQ